MSSAAEWRKNAAPGASRGYETGQNQAPKGRKKNHKKTSRFAQDLREEMY